jgi:hypothetical protein
MNKVSVYGGLGNQMFQYALSVALNQKGNKTRISFSNFLYEKYHNGFDLGRAFNLKLPLHLKVLNFILLNGKLLYKNKVANRLIARYVRNDQNKNYVVYREKNEFVYDENIFKQQSSLLIGTWQVESYFKDIKSILQKEFRFKIPKDKKNKQLFHEIRNSNSVSIHIRRGDYFTQRWESILAVIKDSAYYTKAIDFIEKKIESPRYFIFSDDVQWAKENLRLLNATYIDHNRGRNSYIDMYLMSNCKHNIIANSTFSWWAAWLNSNEKKIVVMPGKWIHDCGSPGIFPCDWVKIEV